MPRPNKRSHRRQTEDDFLETLRKKGLVAREGGTVDLSNFGISTPRPEILAAWTESTFTVEAIGLAHLYGWQLIHLRPAWAGNRMITAVQGDGEGFPDLLALHLKLGGFAAELKVKGGVISQAQKRWLRYFEATGYVAGVYYPADWAALEERFRYGRDGKASEAERRHLDLD